MKQGKSKVIKEEAIVKYATVMEELNSLAGRIGTAAKASFERYAEKHPKDVVLKFRDYGLRHTHLPGYDAEWDISELRWRNDPLFGRTDYEIVLTSREADESRLIEPDYLTERQEAFMLRWMEDVELAEYSAEVYGRKLDYVGI